MRTALVAAAAAVLMVTHGVHAQNPPASPDGKAYAELGGQYVTQNDRQVYQGGKWLEISYGRPILRGRTNIFGSGANYGKDVLAGAPVWRAGANVSTRLKTAAALEIGGKTVPPGEYSMFIDLKPNNWTFVLSSWAAQQTYDPNNKAALWGAYNYTPDKDVARAPMTVVNNPVSVEQLTWGFVNVTGDAGQMQITWDHALATVPFKLVK
jgi:hypothetical protein